MSVTILIGDVIEQLQTLSDESVHCCVTSPPYWGLRDYGTAKWEGGNPECDHKREHFGKNPSDKQLSNSGSAEGHSRLVYKDVCGKCGAVRIDNQIGLEKTPEEYVAKIVEVFREVKRVLRDDGTLWLNLGDSYCGSGVNDGTVNPGISKAKERCDVSTVSRPNTKISGLKPKDLVGIPWRVAFALQADGWYLRSDIIWSKPNPMPESVTDRPTKAHEYVFLLTKKAKYYYDADAVREESLDTAGVSSIADDGSKRYRKSWKDNKNRDPETDLASWACKYGSTTHAGGRNRRTVWEIATQPTPDAHFATFPEALVEPCIKAGTSERGCCPVCGAGWERVVEKESPPMEVYTKTNVKEDVGDFIYKARKDGIKVGYGQKYQNWRNDNPPLTTGWQPTCTCSHDETIPCTVLDPFGGSGTTGLVARNLKRDCILIELNPAYVKIMKKKLRLNEQLDVI